MCVIFHQVPGYTLPYDKLENAVWNNPHGYGIVLKENGRLQTIKELPANGNNPKEIYKILKDNEDIERFVHLRWKTQGDISIENTQPFTVYSSKKREILFMHNGTIHEAPPKAFEGAMKEAGITANSSDSIKFALGILAPVLERLQGVHGTADLTDPYVQNVIHKLWPYNNNRGILISSDQQPLILGANSWSTVKMSDGKEFHASNDEYFDVLKRGDEYERRKKEQAVIQSSVWGGTNSTVPLDLTKIATAPPFTHRYGLTSTITQLFKDKDLGSYAHLLANLDVVEIHKLITDHKADFIVLFMELTNLLKKQEQDIIGLWDDKTKAQTMIVELKKGQHSHAIV